MSRNFLFGFLLLFVFSGMAQKKVNEYKYVIVPDSYLFLEDKDAYQLNSLTKFLFNKYGFEAFIQSDDFPKDLSNNGCKALHADVKEESGIFQTKLIVELKDCNNKVIYVSEQGKSREKDYKTAYHEALRNAFLGIEKLNYKYIGDAKVLASDNSQENKKLPARPTKVKEEVKVDQVDSNKNTILYQLNDMYLVFEAREYGYEVFAKEDALISIGKAFKSSNNKSYILKTNDLSGHGFFDSYGNFILERVNPATNKLVKDILARQ